MKWVLVLLVSGFYKGGPATVPGYSSEEECKQAGLAFVAMEDANYHNALNKFTFVCIPGPRQ